jgi:2-polyprenyl-3-methyl-5-hydroxy-6-metoxy-1,4-benzoquinol methylase
VPSAFAHDFSDYHSGSRSEVIHMVPSAAKKVLDVGGGDGGFLKALKQSHGCETHLAEYSAQSCEVARAHVDKVWEGDFFSTPIIEKFDCITFLDVLEHTTVPLHWLERARGLLEGNGSILASIPNVGHWTVIADLLEGRWDYAPVGIHCITHLRFFTRHSIEAMLDEAGFEVESLEATHVAPPPWWHTSGLKAATSNALNIEDDNLSAYAFLVRAKLK